MPEPSANTLIRVVPEVSFRCLLLQVIILGKYEEEEAEVVPGAPHNAPSPSTYLPKPPPPAGPPHDPCLTTDRRLPRQYLLSSPLCRRPIPRTSSPPRRTLHTRLYTFAILFSGPRQQDTRQHNEILPLSRHPRPRERASVNIRNTPSGP